MDKSANITPIKAVEMLDIDDGVLITVCNQEKNPAKETAGFDFVTLLTEKQNLIELGYHHVQVLRQERDAARTELETVRIAADRELKKQQEVARDELEAVRNAARMQLDNLWNELTQLRYKVEYYEAREQAELMR